MIKKLNFFCWIESCDFNITSILLRKREQTWAKSMQFKTLFNSLWRRSKLFFLFLNCKIPFQLEKSISSGKFYFTSKNSFHLEKCIWIGKVCFKWKSSFELEKPIWIRKFGFKGKNQFEWEKFIWKGKVHFRWESLFQVEKSISRGKVHLNGKLKREENYKRILWYSIKILNMSLKEL